MRVKTIDGEMTFGGQLYSPPPKVVDALGFIECDGKIRGSKRLRGHKNLMTANDAGVPFKVIAAFLRANPESVFTEPR